MACLGIVGKRADSGCCAKVNPPACLISRSPSEPSASAPESTTPIAPSPYATASDEKRRSTGNGRSGALVRRFTSMRPSCTVRSASGGMTYTWSGCTASPAVASDTAIVVFFARISGSRLSCCRVQVLNHDEGHAGCRKGAEKLNQRFEASGRGANSHDEEGRVATGF